MKMKPLYKVSIGRCADGKSFDVEVSVIGKYASSPGRWLPNQAAAQLWAWWAIERSLWKSLRRWKHRRAYIL
jgi:hypothetical protein